MRYDCTQPPIGRGQYKQRSCPAIEQMGGAQTLLNQLSLHTHIKVWVLHAAAMFPTCMQQAANIPCLQTAVVHYKQSPCLVLTGHNMRDYQTYDIVRYSTSSTFMTIARTYSYSCIGSQQCIQSDRKNYIYLCVKSSALGGPSCNYGTSWESQFFSSWCCPSTTQLQPAKDSSRRGKQLHQILAQTRELPATASGNRESRGPASVKEQWSVMAVFQDIASKALLSSPADTTRGKHHGVPQFHSAQVRRAKIRCKCSYPETNTNIQQQTCKTICFLWWIPAVLKLATMWKEANFNFNCTTMSR